MSPFDSCYHPPSRSSFSRIYAEVRENVARDLQQAHFYSGTTDIWSLLTLYVCRKTTLVLSEDKLVLLDSGSNIVSSADHL